MITPPQPRRTRPGRAAPGEAGERDDVEADLFLLALDVERGEGAVGAEAGVVHQELEVAVVRHRALDLAQRGGIGQVGRHRLGAHPVRVLHRLGERLELAAVARHQAQVVAVARQPPREGGADADRRAGHPGVAAAGAGGLTHGRRSSGRRGAEARGGGPLAVATPHHLTSDAPYRGRRRASSMRKRSKEGRVCVFNCALDDATLRVLARR
ncbi:MAG: hypothetical protein U0802_05995 [Candidatus Binatia bacterium]